MTANHPDTTDHNDTSTSNTERHQTDRVLNTVRESRFRQWHQTQQVQQNIREGRAYFNGPATTPPPQRFRPSELLQCHRKIYYRQLNAPEETPDPDGQFWFGERFEEDLIVPFLSDTIGDDLFVQNSIWINFTESTPVGKLQLKGVTDPAIVDSDAHPLVPTEIKTTSAIEHRDGPSPRHRAQLTAYLRGLTAKHDHEIHDGLLIYGDRETFETRTFPVSFDDAFWAEIREWMIAHARARRTDTLPPADPQEDWECEYCAYRHRCGQTNHPSADTAPTGFIPLLRYPKPKVIEYLQAHADSGAKLTPTLAYQYPDLTPEYGVHDWECEACGETVGWDAVEWDGSLSDLPTCPACARSGRYGALRGPTPASQQQGKTTEPSHE